MKELVIGDRAILDCNGYVIGDTIWDYHGEEVLIINTPKKLKTDGSSLIEIAVRGGTRLGVLEGSLKPIGTGTSNPTHPYHYKQGGIEPIEYMRSKMSEEAFRGFCIGNVIKYVSRYEQKNGLEDLRKAQVYLGWAIGTYDEDKEEDEA